MKLLCIYSPGLREIKDPMVTVFEPDDPSARSWKPILHTKAPVEFENVGYSIDHIITIPNKTVDSRTMKTLFPQICDALLEKYADIVEKKLLSDLSSLWTQLLELGIEQGELLKIVNKL
jgi:hypothetical protein